MRTGEIIQQSEILQASRSTLIAPFFKPVAVVLYSIFLLTFTVFQNSAFAAPSSISLTLSALSTQLDFSATEMHNSEFKKTAAINATVTTDNPQGYALYISSVDENTSLDNGTFNHIPSISTGLSETAFTAASWGYSLDNTNFKPIPKLSTMEKIAESQLPANAATVASVNFGVKVTPDLYEGTYQKEIVFTAITNSTKTVSHIVTWANKLHIAYNG